MKTPAQPGKLHLLSGACFFAVAALLATGTFGRDPAGAQNRVGAGLFALAAALQFAAFFKAHRA